MVDTPETETEFLAKFNGLLDDAAEIYKEAETIVDNLIKEVLGKTKEQELEDKVANLEEENENLKKKLKEAQKEENVRTEQVINLHIENSNLNLSLSILISQNEELSMRMAELEQLMADLRDENGIQKAVIQNRAKDLRELETKIEEFNKNTAALEAVVDSYEFTVKLQNIKIKELQQESNNLRNVLEAIYGITNPTQQQQHNTTFQTGQQSINPQMQYQLCNCSAAPYAHMHQIQ